MMLVAELKERVQYRKVVTQHVLAEKTVCGVTIGRGTISVDYIPRKLFKFLSKLFGQVK